MPVYGALNQISQSNVFGHNRPHTSFAQIHGSADRNLRQRTSRIILHLLKFMPSIHAVFTHQKNVSDVHVYSTRESFTSVWSRELNLSIQCVHSMWHKDMSPLCIVPQTKLRTNLLATVNGIENNSANAFIVRMVSSILKTSDNIHL